MTLTIWEPLVNLSCTYCKKEGDVDTCYDSIKGAACLICSECFIQQLIESKKPIEEQLDKIALVIINHLQIKPRSVVWEDHFHRLNTKYNELEKIKRKNSRR